MQPNARFGQPVPTMICVSIDVPALHVLRVSVPFRGLRRVRWQQGRGVIVASLLLYESRTSEETTACATHVFTPRSSR